MTIGLQTGSIFFEVGAPSFMHCFFSTIAYNLENSEWGSKFPYLMNDFYHKELLPENIEMAETELNIIYEALKSFPPNKVVWNIDDLSQSPPWGENIADTITDLSNYFITSDGKDLFEVLTKALNIAKQINKKITIGNF